MTRYHSRKVFSTNNASDYTFTKEPSLYINDYNIGVAYVFNENTGKCESRSVSPYTYASDQTYTQQMIDNGNGFVIRLKSPKSLLHLDSDFVFTGKRVLNEMPTSVFVSSTTNAKINVTNEYAFSDVSLTY